MASGWLYSRPGNDLTYRFPLIVEAVAKLRSRSCIIDGEVVSCGDDGIASSIVSDTAVMTRTCSCGHSTSSNSMATTCGASH